MPLGERGFMFGCVFWIMAALEVATNHSISGVSSEIEHVFLYCFNVVSEDVDVAIMFAAVYVDIHPYQYIWLKVFDEFREFCNVKFSHFKDFKHFKRMFGGKLHQNLVF